MKIPATPPNHEELFTEPTTRSLETIGKILSLGKPTHRGKYYHWDKLRHLTPPDDLSSKDWWLGIKYSRRALYRETPFADKNDNPFIYGEPDEVRRLLHEIDLHGAGELKTKSQVSSSHTREAYLINSLIEEAITSSQLEGAATTKIVAKEMLRERRQPRDKSEKMIVNNYLAMEFIKEHSKEDLTPSMVYELHKIVTSDTLDNPLAEGELRTTDDIHVSDGRDGTTVHIPPKAKELKKRIEKICEFANSSNNTEFLHPTIRAIILHFMLAYDHPFEDGNGRTARALFYWSMLRQGYWTMEFVSISNILKKAPAKYTRAYLYSETDGNDITYFIIHQLEVIKRAILALLEHLKKKSEEIRSVEELIRRSTNLQDLLNHRQTAVINRALRKPGALFSINSHKGSHNVTYQTARTDLLKLVDEGLLEKLKVGNAFVFRAAGNLSVILEGLKN